MTASKKTMAWRGSMWNISSLCHRGACVAAWGLFLFSLLSPWRLSDFIFVKVNVFQSFLWVHSCSSLSLFSGLGSPSPRPPICLLFTVNSNTTGCSEPLGMKSRLISDGKITASSSYRTWGIDTFTWHPQFARLDKQGKTNAWSPAQNSRSEWIQVGQCDAQVLKFQCWLWKVSF